jgi:hypothetical protein
MELTVESLIAELGLELARARTVISDFDEGSLPGARPCEAFLEGAGRR